MRSSEFAIAITMGIFLASVFPDKANAKDKPNIVLIVVEDLSSRIGAFGDNVALTPNIDKLAREGVRYTNVFTAAGVCAPSRASLITGTYPQSIGAQHMRTSSFGRDRSGEFGTFGTDGVPYEVVPPADLKAFPEILRSQGYYTINKSKTDYQIGEPFTIWDEDSSTANLTSKDKDQPFFAMFSNNDTHESRLFRTGWAEKTKGAREIAARNARDLEELSHRTNPANVIVPDFLPDTLEVRKDIAQLYDGVQLMDSWVGRLLDQLESSGHLNNTIIIWTTDHGDGLPRAKRSLYDSGLHVPMIIRFPDGRMAGSVNDEMISFVDLAPTILSLAGISPPAYEQGRAFLDPKTPKRNYIYAVRGRLDEHPDKSQAVRDNRYKYIRNYTPNRPFFAPLYYRENLSTMAEMRRLLNAGELDSRIAKYFQTPRAAEELYDTKNDPYELDNLAEETAFQGIKRRLATEMDEWSAEVGDLGNITEKQMVEDIMWPGAEQPKTGAPIIEVSIESNGKATASLRSLTGGASIGYRVNSHDDTPWLLYVAPVELPKGTMLEAKAIRYGYKESSISRIETKK